MVILMLVGSTALIYYAQIQPMGKCEDLLAQRIQRRQPHPPRIPHPPALRRNVHAPRGVREREHRDVERALRGAHIEACARGDRGWMQLHLWVGELCEVVQLDTTRALPLR
jgi:hypothetical protein